ncbi:MAG: sigma-54-dependent Fis family transcriptional regulator [Pirellulales bacterium]|nr:sigma-54-dependent Fis family transcriptional regulator [Pirellulales bacterium]
MEQFNQLILDVWREACRHIEIGESVAANAPILFHRLPVDAVLVRQIDLERSCVETVAAGACRPVPLPKQNRTDCTPEQLRALASWCRAKESLHLANGQLQSALTGLLPTDLEGEILAGPLNGPDGPVGILILVAREPQAFRDRHVEMLSSLLEPFTVWLENNRRLRELRTLREAAEADKQSLLRRLGRTDISDSIVGADSGLRPVMERVQLVARADVPVLILGETGSGKEVVARAIHTQSSRSNGPFLRVNCGAIAPELVDSELFGHERGSFTGATGLRKGWFERADGGTLFLDECGELPPSVQVRLLRILQDGTFERVGGEQQLHVNVRIVAATHRDLEAMVADGRFREDLWYRLAVFPIRLPPLRDRLEDIPAMATHFAMRSAHRLGMPLALPSVEDINLLVSYSWPGNVRELAAVIERAAILGDGKHLAVAKALGTVSPRPVPAAAPTRPISPLGEFSVATTSKFISLDEAMRRHIAHALAETNGRIEGPDGAAKLLDINPHTLRARMRKLGVDWKTYRRNRRTALPSAGNGYASQL